MLKKLKQMKYFCGLDLGTHTIKASLVCVRDEENLDLLAVAESPSIGIRETSINDISELGHTITRLIAEVSGKAGVRVSAVTLGVSSDMISCRYSEAVIPLIDAGTKVISRYDVKRLDDQAKMLGTALEEEIVHDIPQSYKIDDVNLAQNPLGLMGRKLQVKQLLLLANAVRLRNLTKAVHQAGYEVDDISLSSYAASDVVLSDALKSDGCVLIDIGANTTTVMFFHNHRLGDIQFIPWGGQNVTQGLSGRLSVTLDIAEEIKKTHAIATEKERADLSGDILIKRDKGFLPISRASVCEAVNWEIENLLTHLETVIKGSGLFNEMSKGVVMIGGGSLLPGLMERIEQRTNLTVSMGVATNGLNNPAIYATVIGLAQRHYVRNKQKTIDLKSPLTIKDKIVGAVQDLCQEYF